MAFVLILFQQLEVEQGFLLGFAFCFEAYSFCFFFIFLIRYNKRKFSLPPVVCVPCPSESVGSATVGFFSQ